MFLFTLSFTYEDLINPENEQPMSLRLTDYLIQDSMYNIISPYIKIFKIHIHKSGKYCEVELDIEDNLLNNIAYNFRDYRGIYNGKKFKIADLSIKKI